MQGLWFIPSLIFGAAQGFTSGNWQMFGFGLLSLLIWPLSRWLKHHREFPLEGKVAFDGVDVWIGENRLPRREIFWRRSWHQVVWDGLSATATDDSRPELLNAARRRGFAGSLAGTIWFGANRTGDFEFNLAQDGPHLLVVGATGTGKSELLRLLVTGWLAGAQPVELTLIDFKGGATMAQFAKHPRVIGLATDLATTHAVAIAVTLEKQLIARQIELANVEAASIEEFLAQGRSMNRQIIVIDELGELLRQHPRLAQVLEQVAARGRSLGMHLVLANQSMAGISRTLLVNLRAKVAIGEMDPIDLSLLGFKSRIANLETDSNWRPAKLKNGSGAEQAFCFPIGF